MANHEPLQKNLLFETDWVLIQTLTAIGVLSQSKGKVHILGDEPSGQTSGPLLVTVTASQMEVREATGSNDCTGSGSFVRRNLGPSFRCM